MINGCMSFCARAWGILLILALMLLVQTPGFAAQQEEQQMTKQDLDPESVLEELRKKSETDININECLANAEKNNADQAVYEGVTNERLLQGGNGKPCICLYYPEFGNEKVDKAIKDFIKNQADEYEQDVKDILEPDGENPPSYSMWDMTGFFTLEKPNPSVASVTFNIYSYSGGAHGSLFIRCLNYDLTTGKAIEFSDLFQEPEKALKILSELCMTKLMDELGEDADEDMIQSGTAADMENFSNLSLTSSGLYVEFQPYQVGPWSIGPQRVKISLEELAPAGPQHSIWTSLPEKN